MKKRILSVLMAIAMILTIAPLSMFTSFAVNAPVVTLTVPEKIATSGTSIPSGKSVVFTSDVAVTNVTIAATGGAKLGNVTQSGNQYTWKTTSSTATADVIKFTVSYTYSGQTYTKSAFTAIANSSEAWVFDKACRKYKWTNSIGLNKKLYYGYTDTYVRLIGSTGGSNYSFGKVTEDRNEPKNFMSVDNAPTGYYYVDASVYSRIQDVPGAYIQFSYEKQYHDEEHASTDNVIISNFTTELSDGFPYNVSKIADGTDICSTKAPTAESIFSGPVTIGTYGGTVSAQLRVQTKDDKPTNSQIYIKFVIIAYNKAALRSLVNEESVLNRQFFDYETDAEGTAAWNDYVAAYDAAYSILVNPVATQDAIDTAVRELADAIKELKKHGVYCDYTEVEAAIAKANSIARANYVNFAPVEAAINAVDWKLVNNETNRATVKGYADAIYAAINANLKDANYSAVDAALASIPNDIDLMYDATCPQHGDTIKVPFYSATTRQAVVNAKNAVIRGKKIDEQSVVDGYAAAINSAVAALKAGPADYTFVNEQDHPDYDRKYYTTDSLVAYDTRVSQIKKNVITNLSAPQQATVNEYAKQYYEAKKTLLILDADKYPGDYTNVELAKAKIPTQQLVYYTTDSVAALNAVLNGINYHLSSVQQSIIEGYATAILDAIANLKMGDADYSDVQAAIDEAGTLNPDDYYDFSFVMQAINAVDYTKKANEQSIVDGYEANIRNAIAALIPKPADYSAVNAAKAKIPANLNMFTEASVEFLNVTLASTASNLPLSRQGEVDAYAQNILYAISCLESACKATMTLSYDKASVATGEEVTITCNLNTTYHIGMSQFIIFYDKNKFEAVGTGKDAITACEELTANGSISATTMGPQQQYPSTFTQEMKDQYGMVIVKFSPYSSSTSLPMFNPTKAIFSFKLKVKDEVNASSTTTVFMSSDSANIAKNVYCYYKETADAKCDTVTTDLVYYLNGASVDLSIVYDADARAADYTAVEEAIAKVPENMADLYTEESASAVRNAVNSVNWELTVADQATVNGYAVSINFAISKLVLKPVLADYTEVEAIIEEYRNMDFSAVQSFLAVKSLMAKVETAIREVDWELTEEYQETVDGYVENIRAKIDAVLEKIKSITLIAAKDDSVTIDNTNKAISGFSEGTSIGIINSVIDKMSGTEVKYVETANGIGTGTKIEVYFNGALVSTYDLVIFGDLNGDGWVDAADARVMKQIIKGRTDYAPGSAHYIAADVDRNGVVDNDDLVMLNNAISLGEPISQIVIK